MRRFPLIITIFIFLFIFPSLLRDQDVRIKTENGVQVVYNPKNPAPPPGTPKKILLREDLCIGDQGAPPGYKLRFPKNHYPYYFFICGDEGKIYVRTYKKDKEGNFSYDVFDPEGRYIAKFSLPGIDFLYVIKKNKMYSMVWEDEKGIPVVKRYSVTWK